ncbi:MAG: TonB-dependent receptor [Bacteroidia bacterium]
MKKANLLGLFLSLLSVAQAQVLIKGRVVDAVTDEYLSGVRVSAKSIATESNSQGLFELSLPMGEYSLVAQLDGYRSDTLFVQGDRPLVSGLVFHLEDLGSSIQAVQITASIAKDRKTPIAYSNLSSRDLAERLGSQDMPLLLNQTPGVYATSQGGGAGDARITIRGFNQRNIAVMIDGIPVNDMENGWVYWSNWFGLSSVTALTQVQRGLGSSRIANPAVGGTMNIITKGLGNKEYLEANVETGDSRYQKFGFTYASGRLPGDWGFTLNFTKRSSTGYVDALYDDMYAYFAKVEKQWGQKHTLSFTAMGAPQSHGQRSFRARLQLYDAAFAQDMNMYDPNNPNMAVDMGRRYNQHWGEFYEATIDPNTGDTTWGSLRRMNERENMFHKPQIYLKHDWKPSDKWLISSTVYLSVGTGGGTSAYGSRIKQYPSLYGQYNFQDIWFLNTSGNFFVDPIDPLYSSTEKKSMGVIQRSVNNHTWLGALSTVQRKLNDRWNLTGGIDLRTYRGQHYREAYDLLGGDYFIPDVRDLNPAYDAKHMYRVGDIHGYHNDGLVRWAGLFGELEYSRARSSAFLNLSSSGSWYQRIDYFNGPVRGVATATDWVFRQGLTAKAGFNQNISRKLNVFTNLGYLNRPTRFNNVFDTRNRVVQSAKNELVYSAEAGLGYHSRRLALNWNALYPPASLTLGEGVFTLACFIRQDTRYGTWTT